MREKRLISDALASFELDLRGLEVLTEAASGNFVWTPIIAALAGAEVIAISRDSRFSTYLEVREKTEMLAELFGVARRIEICRDISPNHLAEADIITNTGFLRPLDQDKLKFCGPKAVIPLMWETWEFREKDLDLSYCFQNEIPVLGTNESDWRLATLEYLGAVVKKLLFECGIEVFRAQLALVGGGRFLDAIEPKLMSEQAVCRRIAGFGDDEISFINRADALIFADHESSTIYLPEAILRKLDNTLQIIHISGGLAPEALVPGRLRIHPAQVAPAYSMSVTTDYVGPKPVIDLHAAGLKVGEIMARLRHSGLGFGQVIKEALRTSELCQDFSEAQKRRYFQ